nr:MAG TPA: hypothetical protein [Caudoviricetes sp.]
MTGCFIRKFDLGMALLSVRIAGLFVYPLP